MNSSGSDPVRREWESIFDAIGHPAVILDPHHKVIAANAASVKLTGKPASEIIGRQCYEIFHLNKASVPPAGCPMEKMLRSGQAETAEIEVETLGGIFVVSCTPMFDEQGNLEKVIHIATDITGHRRTEKQLRDNEGKFKRLMDDSPVAISITNQDGTIEYINRKHREILGYSPEDIPDLEHWWALAYPDETERNRIAAEWKDLAQRVISGENPGNRERRVVCKDGTVKDVEIQLTPAEDKIIVAFFDVTERRKMEELLRRSKEDWEECFNTINEAITIHDHDFNIILANRAAGELLGIPLLNMTRQKCFQSYHGTGCPPEGCPSCEVLKTGKPTVSEMFEPHLGKHVEIKALPRLDKTGALIGLIHVVRDITQRKQAEDALRDQQRFSLDLIDSSATATFVLDTGHRIMLWNKACEELTGCSATEMLGTSNQWKPFYSHKRSTVADVIIDSDTARLPELYKSFSQSTLNHQGVRAEGWYASLGGRERYIIFEAAPIYDSKGGLIAAIETLQDITERKRAEDALAESEERYRMLFKSSPVGIFHYDNNLHITDLNSRFAEIIGSGVETLRGLDMNTLNDRGVLPSLLEAISGKEGFFEGPYMTTTSSIQIWCTMHTTPMLNSKGEIIGGIGIVEDHTDKHKLEQQLRQSQKLEAIGQLAGGVAHDFNNILSAIVGYAHLTLLKLGKDDPLRLNLDQILQASDRATTLTQSLLAFSRKQVINPRPNDLNEILRSVEKFLLRLISEDIEITTACAADKIIVFADSGQIEQLLMNLVTNARDAMPRGGNITIGTESVQLDEEFIESHGNVKAGGYALISVTDTGEGMNAETRERIFEPFFTTKAEGKGTGLGLSMVYGIVKQHDGYIYVYSEPGKGATFKVYLPLYRGAAVVEPVKTEPAAVTGGSETILLAEDDASLRKLAGVILRNYGYRVIEAVDGEDAVAKYGENRDLVQLVILDGIMPKKNGKEAYEEIRIINPSVRTIFASGYAEDILSREGLLEPGINFLLKPITPSELLRKVREVLDA
jgi:two-component system NtrC family sensor kinase